MRSHTIIIYLPLGYFQSDWLHQRNKVVFSLFSLTKWYYGVIKSLLLILLFWNIWIGIDSPVCVESSVSVVGASLDESISIPCRVNADPPDVEFEWSFSSSGERFEVPHGHYTTVQDVSMNGADGQRDASAFYDSEETHGENDGK